MRFPAESLRDQGSVDATTTGVVTTTYSPVVGAEFVPPAPTNDMGVDSKNGVANLPNGVTPDRSEEHTSELQSQSNLVCRLLLEKKKVVERPRLAGAYTFDQDPHAT